MTKKPRPVIAVPQAPDLPPRNLYQPALTRALADRDTILRALARLTDKALEELYRRGAHSTRPDGQRAAGYDSVAGQAELTPVEAAADQRAFPGTGSHDDDTFVARPQPDRTGKWITELFDGLRQMADLAVGVDGRRDLALSISADPPGTRVTTLVDCINPFLPTHPALPRPRAGRCEPCYRYRLDHNGMDRPAEPSREQAS